MALRRLAVVLLLFVAVPAFADEVPPPSVQAVENQPVEIIELEVVFAQLRSPARDGAELKPIVMGPFDLAALEKAGRVVATQRVKLTTVAGHAALAQFGSSQPRVTGVAPSPRAGGFAGSRQVQFQQVGTLVGLTPTLRDDRIVVEVSAERSLPSLAEGPLLDKGADGEEIRSSGIDTMNLRTVVAVADGQSAIVGGSVQQEGDDASATWVILTARRVK